MFNNENNIVHFYSAYSLDYALSALKFIVTTYYWPTLKRCYQDIKKIKDRKSDFWMVYVRDKCLNFDILTYCMLDFYIQRHKSGSKLENQKLFLVTGDINFYISKRN